MKYIANILTDEPFEKNVLYNIVSGPENLVKDVPTLIVGWEKTKELYPDASIIEWHVCENIYWTYGKYERRDKFEANVAKFDALAYKKFSEKIKYSYYDVIFDGPERFESFMNLLGNDTQKTIYIANDIMYVNISGSNNVFGLSLRDCDYVDSTLKKKIFSTVYTNKSINLVKNENTDGLKNIRYKLSNMLYTIAYIYS